MSDEATKALKEFSDNNFHKEIKEIKLDEVNGSTYCQFSVVENKMRTLYKNQEKILQAIKLIAERL